MAQRILYIDDEPEFVDPQVVALREAGYEVELVSDPAEVMGLLSNQKFDLVILDLIMPPSEDDAEETDEGVDYSETGVRLHEEIRKNPAYQKMPILFITVVRDRKITNGIIELEKRYHPDARVLSKPIRSLDVIDEVNRILGHS